MRWRRRPSSRQLESWLRQGEPAWVERWLDDPATVAQLDRLAALSEENVSHLRAVLEPRPGFGDRTIEAVRERVDDIERLGVLLSLLGLGPRTAGSLLDDSDQG